MKRCYSCMKEYESAYDMCHYCGYTQDEPPKEMYFLHPGTVIADRYVIGVSVGSGGFGITYKAWDSVLAKVVAIKEYYPAGLVNRVPGEKNIIVYSGSRGKECANGMVRFLEEARNMAKFNTHPNIINIYDFFEENHTAYIIMEFLDGVNYKEFIKRQGGRVPVDKAVEVTEAVLEALKEVHKSGILHRDISPDNIFICNNGAVKLIDFGAARFSSTEDERTRSVILKPGFAPPEQYQTKSKQGPWTDIYALGATLYRAITGNVPEESVNRVEEDLLTDPEKFCPEISHNLNNIILRSMALLPELRFQSTTEFLDALHSNANIKDVRRELTFRKKKRFISVAAVSVIVLIGAFTCFRVLNQKKAAAAILDESAITVWIPAESGEEAEKQEIFEAAIQQFVTDYPQVSVNVVCMERDEYDTHLQEALKTGELPTLFESSAVDISDFDKMADVSDVFTFIDEDQYYFYDKYKTHFPSKKQLPMAFLVPVLYYNTILHENEDVPSLLQQGMVELTTDNVLTGYNLYSGRDPVTSVQGWNNTDSVSAWLDEAVKNEGWSFEDAEEQFLDNQYPCILSDSAFYNDVQKKMAGIYEIELLTGDNLVGGFKDCYSINADASDAEKAAAIQVLVYMLTDTAQDICYVQNGSYLPLNKSVYAAYAEVNTEFAGLSEGFDHLIFAGEGQEALNQWYESLE